MLNIDKSILSRIVSFCWFRKTALYADVENAMCVFILFSRFVIFSEKYLSPDFFNKTRISSCFLYVKSDGKITLYVMFKTLNP